MELGGILAIPVGILICELPLHASPSAVCALKVVSSPSSVRSSLRALRWPIKAVGSPIAPALPLAMNGISARPGLSSTATLHQLCEQVKVGLDVIAAERVR